MQPVEITLEGWEHLCCGETRAVGDEVTISVARAKDGSLIEVPHDYTGGRRKIPIVKLHGVLKAIDACPGLSEHRGGVTYEVVGHGPPVSYQSTEATEADFGSDDQFVFTLQTDDSLPTETWDPKFEA